MIRRELAKVTINAIADALISLLSGMYGIAQTYVDTATHGMQLAINGESELNRDSSLNAIVSFENRLWSIAVIVDIVFEVISLIAVLFLLIKYLKNEADSFGLERIRRHLGTAGIAVIGFLIVLLILIVHK